MSNDPKLWDNHKKLGYTTLYLAVLIVHLAEPFIPILIFFKAHFTHILSTSFLYVLNKGSLPCWFRGCAIFDRWKLVRFVRKVGRVQVADSEA